MSREEEILRRYSKSGPISISPIMTEELKRNIRESFIYAIRSALGGLSKGMITAVGRTAISDFYTSLNRKLILTNEETKTEISLAYSLWDKILEAY